MMKGLSIVVLGAVLALVGCKTPDKYVPREAGVTVEEAGMAPGTPDAPPGKPDASAADASSGDVAATLMPDTAPAGLDGAPPADTAPTPCSNGTTRCAPSGTAVEICMNGQWTVKETCPLTCSGATCSKVCMGGVPCTQGIKPCHQGATFCATPMSEPVCNDSGVDDSKGGCGGGQVCRNGDCVPACQGGVACTQGIGPCRKGATFCASPTSTPVCNDSGVDDSKGGCGAGQICSGGQCVQNPCSGPSSGNLVPNAGFDSSIWPKYGNTALGPGSWSNSDARGCTNSGAVQVATNEAARVCITFGAVNTIYAGYMVNRSTSEGQLGCYVDTWYLSPDCQNAWDLGNEEVLVAPNLTGWQQVSGTMSPPAMTRSLLLSCHLVSATAPALFDRFFVRTAPGGF